MGDAMETYELFQIVRDAVVDMNAAIDQDLGLEPETSQYSLENCTFINVRRSEPEWNPIEVTLVLFGPGEGMVGREVYVVEIDYKTPTGKAVAIVRYVWPHHCHALECQYYERIYWFDPSLKRWILRPPPRLRE